MPPHVYNPDGQMNNRNPTMVLNVEPQVNKPHSMSPEEEAKYEMQAEMEEFENTHFLVLTVKNAQKSQLWIFLLSAYCAMRAATPFTVWMAYLILIARVT